MSTWIDDWRATPQLTPLVLILLLVPAAFYGTTAAMADIWRVNETFTHGFLILPISLWLIWQRRELVAGVRLQGDPRALVLWIPTLGLWALATLMGVAVVQQIAMVALLPLTVWLLLGPDLVRALLFPLCYLFFAVPLGQSLIPPMMEFTADFTVAMVQLSGVPIYRDGLSFQLPSGNWSVVEECSGVRYLIASAALGTIYAYLTYSSYRKRAVFILASLLVPIVANGLRAYGIVMIGHLSGMKYAVGADHLLYGWVFFGIVIFVLFWIGGFWADPPESIDADGDPQDSEVRLLPGALLIVAMLLFSSGLNWAINREVSLPDGAAFNLPEQAGAWTATGAPDWQPRLHNPDLTAHQRYDDSAGHSVSLSIGYYHSQRDGAEAISSLNRLTDPYDDPWKLTAAGAADSVLGPINENEIMRQQRKRLVWSAYVVGDDWYTSPYRAKIAQVLALLRGNRQAAYLTLSTDFDDDLPALRQRLDDALSALAPALLAQMDAQTDAQMGAQIDSRLGTAIDAPTDAPAKAD